MTQILVVGREWKFRALVRAELREEGYEALGLESLEEASTAIARGEVSPGAIVFDLAESVDRECDLATLASLARLAPIILLASHLSLPDPAAVPQGVPVLFRPLRIADVVNQVRALLKTS